MLILLTNDDGIYAPGLAALERELSALGEVMIVAPAAEQSGVGHSITYLSPLIVKEVYQSTGVPGEERRLGWAVEGSPADCVKIGVQQFCPRHPDLVVSGINSGLNAGINVLYSGTVAAAIEGAFFGITSVAVSLEFDEHARFDRAARLARHVIRQILDNKSPEPQLYNLNIPTAALDEEPEVCAAPMNVTRYGGGFERRVDPWGRDYYWMTGGPPESVPGHETDLSALAKGKVTLTPLGFDLTRRAVLEEMQRWQFRLPPKGDAAEPNESIFVPSMRIQNKKRKTNDGNAQQCQSNQ
ncbi:MAG: 5'/3'-nucleotidase SurE [Pirellulaceae bacterium]|nr:5'/3'-nucleotidase SurE [Pirellulaceae bacterium]